ncbi:hypothetical protein T07_10321 [Trichinella nelsoni]|uniref:Uncharacterized protein n=1 Tax=Trichinella nelsoni TaxID=6336 RepID=A0A0V0S9X2_9BILA|nr:hypothetical protein T07_10321 [Trichinella nelsoni]
MYIVVKKNYKSEPNSVIAVNTLSDPTWRRSKFALLVGLIYYFAWWKKFVVILAPFRWNNCCHRLPFDLGHLRSIIRTKAYEKAASRAESGEKKAAWIE